MASRMALLALLVLAAVAAVSAHSWLDCADWRFNNPAAMTDPSLRRWSDADGKCYGHARRFEVTQKIFGKMDEVQFFRHYVQPFSSGALACRNNAGTSSSSGSSEGVLSPRSLAYAPNKNPYGLLYGTMAKVVPGQTLCWRWPAKNHFAHVNVNTNPLFINWDDVPNRPPPSLTQAEMDTKRVAQVLWANCPVPGPASNGDSTGVGSELRPCGGCFTVPQRSPGIYTVQWEWPFKNANSETYTSCADIEVLGSATTPVNCAVSAWSAWGTCSSNCGTGSQTRTRTITTQPTVGANAGTACPALTESQSCNTQSCAANGGSSIGVGISEHVVYEDSLVDFTDWSWARNNYNLAATNIVRSGSRSISWTPRAWEAIYFNHNLGVVSVADFQSISFWINGGSSSGQRITFSLVTTSRTSSPLFSYPIPRSSIRANTWNKVEIVFSRLKLISQRFDGIWWQEASGRSQPTVYIDDINFMHVHTGGPVAAITEDPCATVTCEGNSACLGGQCFCTNGYYGEGCLTPGSITEVSFKSLAELDTTTIEGGGMYTVSWTGNGTLPFVSVLLYKAGSNIPEHLATQVVNTGSYTWEVPSTLPSGTYTIRVAYTRSVFGESPALTKTTAAVDNGCDDCNGHGVCDDDTAPACVCRYGYTGDDCDTAPAGITSTRVTAVVGAPISLYQEDKDKFEEVLRADLAAGLLVEPDQIDIESVSEHTGDTSLVTFDILNGGQFADSTLGLESASGYNAALASQLAQADSAINRGTYTYALAPSANAATAARASSVLVASALALAAVAAVAF